MQAGKIDIFVYLLFCAIQALNSGFPPTSFPIDFCLLYIFFIFLMLMTDSLCYLYILAFCWKIAFQLLPSIPSRLARLYVLSGGRASPGVLFQSRCRCWDRGMGTELNRGSGSVLPMPYPRLWGLCTLVTTNNLATRGD